MLHATRIACLMLLLSSSPLLADRGAIEGRWLTQDKDGWIRKQIVITGDVTGEGTVDITDLLFVAYFIMGSMTPTEEQILIADCNRDGHINALDLVCIANIILKEMP